MIDPLNNEIRLHFINSNNVIITAKAFKLSRAKVESILDPISVSNVDRRSRRYETSKDKIKRLKRQLVASKFKETRSRKQANTLRLSRAKAKC